MDLYYSLLSVVCACPGNSRRASCLCWSARHALEPWSVTVICLLLHGANQGGGRLGDVVVAMDGKFDPPKDAWFCRDCEAWHAKANI